jgi:cytochrome c-type biogenesis protein
MEIQNGKQKGMLVVLSVVLFVIIGISLAWLSQQTAFADDPGLWFIAFLSFAAGLSMIVLPCTLPLVFVIIPMCAGKGYKKGFIMALLFGLGLTITITIYGLVLASLGKYFGMSRGSLWLFLVVGILAYVFGLYELKLLKIPMPAAAIPKVVQRGGDYWKSFGTGLLLGNVGIACPNPLFYVLLVYIAALPDPATGAFVAVLHGLGRATPLILMAVLAILGIQTTRFVVEKRVSIEKLTGYGLVVFGAFVLVAWIFSTPGFWILETPPDIIKWLVFIAISAIPALISVVKNKRKKVR